VTPSVRRATTADLAVVCEIERASFSDPWPRASFLSHLSEASDTFLVAEANGTVAGYALVRVVDGESELLNIAVAGAFRRTGLGARLLDAGIAAARARGAAEMWLEVRESNVGAQALYASRGFAPVGRRRRYYELPREDALVFRAVLDAEGNDLVPHADAGLSGQTAEDILSSASKLPRQEIR
jgi:ribosomal-protein-alanine N-acetyltransferase